MLRTRRALPRTTSASLLLLAAITTGCGFVESQDWLGTRDPQPILHASLPQAHTYGGPVLSSPQVVPIFFASDPLQNDLERFLSKLARSEYWNATTGEYGVGKLRVASSIVVDEPPPASIDSTDVEPWLARHLEGSSPGWPAPNRENLYVVFYPEGVTAPSGTPCTGSGFHLDGSMDAGREASFVYAVVSECRKAESGASLDSLTWGLSYELISSVTDPFVITNPAYYWVADSQLAWSYFADSGEGPTGSAELPALCYLEAGPAVSMRLDGEFEVARSWSNLAASQQQDPCVPSTGEPYFGAAPDLTESVPLKLPDLEPYETKGLRVPLHESRTVDVRLFATSPRSEFHVSAEEIPLAEGDAPTLGFEWDRQTGNDHEFLHLTIRRLKNGPLGGTQIRVTSGENDDSDWTHGWMGFVAN